MRSSYVELIYLVVPAFLVYMLVSRARRQRRIQEAVQTTIQPGLRVMTTSGVHATVISLQDDATVVLEIAPGVHTRWARLAVAEVFDAGSTGTTDDNGTTDAVNDHDDRTLT